MREVILSFLFALNAKVFSELIGNGTVPATVLQGGHHRIFKGSMAERGQFKYMVLVYNINKICSASLLTPSWVLTAAHCVSSGQIVPKNIFLVAGESEMSYYIQERQYLKPSESVDEAEFEVQERRGHQVHVHPEYNPTTFDHDIALIKTDKPFILGDNVATIKLSQKKFMKEDEPLSCVQLGWGLDEEESHGVLNYIEDKKIYKKCKYKKGGDFICVEPDFRGTCVGDSGSPLVCDGKVWGVASHFNSLKNGKCGYNEEEYYVDVYTHLSWTEQIRNASKHHKFEYIYIYILWFIITFCL